MRAVAFMRDKVAGWLLAAVLAAPGAHAAAQSFASPNSAQIEQVARLVKDAQPAQAAEASASPSLEAPRPAPAHRLDLRPAFTKTTPTSLADLRSIEQHVEALSARVSPAVVAVEVGNGSGSGVVVSPDGLVLTAGHVCGAPGRNVRFTFHDGKTAHGKTVGVGSDSDTGLMRITDRGP